MTYPNFAGKQALQAVFSAADSIEYRRSAGRQSQFSAPASAIVCFQRNLHAWILEKHEVKRTAVPYLSLLASPGGVEVGIVSGFGFGAPPTVSAMEQMTALGTDRFVAVGLAGALQKQQQIGDIVICDRAIRDEGTSYHYVPAEKYAVPSASLTKLLTEALDREEAVYSTGTSWTTDAPYRETREEILHYQAEGVMTVDMEASAMFAVGAVRCVQVAAAFVISDSLADLKWNPQFHSGRTKESLRRLFSTVLRSLASSEAGQ